MGEAEFENISRPFGIANLTQLKLVINAQLTQPGAVQAFKNCAGGRHARLTKRGTQRRTGMAEIKNALPVSNAYETPVALGQPIVERRFKFGQ